MHVRQWTDELLEIAQDLEDVLGLETLMRRTGSHIDEAPEMYRTFQRKDDASRSS